MSAQAREASTAEARFAPWLVRFRRSARREPELSLERLDDLADPLSSTAASRSVRVIFRGRLNGRAELRTGLGLDDRPMSDAELALHAYERWGQEALRKLRGVFAVFIWDGERERFLCARDPHGIEPLFYARAGEDYVFAPSPTTLLQLSGVPNRPNRAVLAEQVLLRWPVPDDTCYEAIRRVPLGHTLAVANGSASVARHWHPLFDLRDHGWVQPDELDAFGELLERAVSQCLEVGPSGILLSGGLDSSSVAAVAADLAKRRNIPIPLALSLLFPTAETSEEAVQIGVASELGMPQITVDLLEAIAPEGLVSRALELNAGWPWPLMGLWVTAYIELVRAGAERGIRVVITGDGGDEWLAVSRSVAADLLTERRLHSLYDFIRVKRLSYNMSTMMALRSVLWSGALRPILRDHALTFLGRLAPRMLSELRERRHRRRANDMPDWLPADPELRAEVVQRCLDSISTSDRIADPAELGGGFRYYVSDAMSVDHPLASFDQEDAYERGKRAGVEYLHPYLEPDLVSFLFRVPPELLWRGGREKGLVRDTMAQRFPHFGFESQKKLIVVGFIHDTLRREVPEAWRRLGGGDALVDLGLVAGDQLRSIVDESLASPNPEDVRRAWDLIKVESWLRGLV